MPDARSCSSRRPRSRRVERVWIERFGTIGPDADDAPDDDALTRVVAFLDDEPLALSSFAVLDALAHGTGGWGEEPWADALQVRVFERGEALLYRHVSRELGFETPDGPSPTGTRWSGTPRRACPPITRRTVRRSICSRA